LPSFAEIIKINHMKKALLFCTTAILIHCSANAQDWSASVLVGASTYQGDLVKGNFSTKDLGLAIGIGAHRSLNDKFSLRGTLQLLQISGDDANSDEKKARGISFTNNLINMGIHLQYDILGKDRFANTGAFKATWTPYVTIGLAGMTSNPKVNASVPANYLQADRDHSQKLFISTPIGVGVKFDVSKHLNIGLEWSSNPVFSDYLDGVSQSGEPDKNDWFSSIGLRVLYYFQSQKELSATMK
jgi:opacity protein-like surface antigen